MKMFRKITLFILFTGIIILPVLASAQVGQLETTPTTGSIVSCAGVTSDGNLPACNWCTFVQLFGNLVQYSIYIAVMLSSLMFAYTGFLFLTNNGDPKNVTKAREIFKRSIFGIIAILAAWLIVNAIMTKLASNLGLGEDWNSITGCDSVDLSSTGTTDYIPNMDLYNDLNTPDTIYASEQYYTDQNGMQEQLDGAGSQQELDDSGSVSNFFPGR